MNGRSGLIVFFLFLFLAVIILFQILSMVQADRLYERLNTVLDKWTQTAAGFTQKTRPETTNNKDLPTEEYPGDKGDWLVWCLDAEPATLNIIHASSGTYANYIVSGGIFESLLEYDPDKFELRTLLAEKYEVSDDGLEITFRIRDDVYFSDGVRITADDVLFTYKTIINPGVDAANLANYYQDIDKVIKISNLEVKFIMKKIYFRSLEFAGGMPIFPKHIYDFNDPEEFNKHISNPVGSGPYVFEKWDVGREVVLRRNENYWGHKPKLEKIVYRFITNSTAAIQALQVGQVDFMRPLAEQYAELCKDEEFTKEIKCLSYWHPGVGYFWMGWNQDRPFFKNRRVRLALTHLVNRELICKTLLKVPEARIPTGIFYIFGPQNDPTIKPWPYDPERAKELLDEAGWVDTNGDGIRDKDGIPFRFKYMIGNIPIHKQIAKLLKDEAAKIGIEVIPDPYEWSVFIQRLQDREFDAVNLAWHGGLAQDPYQIWHSSQIGKRGSNYIGFNNPEADAIIEEARQTLDDKKRNRLYRQFHQILHKEQPYTFIYTRPEQRFLNKRFENVIVHKLGLDSFEWHVPKEKQRYK